MIIIESCIHLRYHLSKLYFSLFSFQILSNSSKLSFSISTFSSIFLKRLINLMVDFFKEDSGSISKCLLRFTNENKTSPNSSLIPLFIFIASFNSVISSSTFAITWLFSQSKPTSAAFPESFLIEAMQAKI